MAKIEIKDASGAATKEVELNAAVFGIEPNVHVMHTAVRSQQAALRQGTHDTKTRGEVRGGGRKPYRQKGTGRARQGTIRAPHYAGGGVVFGPHPRSYAFRVNRKEIKLAMRSALSAKLADEQLMVVEDFSFEKPSTKAAVACLKAWGLEETRRVTIVIPNDDVMTYLSFRNIPTVTVVPVADAHTLELLDNKVLVLTASTLNKLEEVLS